MQVREGCFVLIVIVLSLVLLCVVCDWTCLAFVAYLDRRFKWHELVPKREETIGAIGYIPKGTLQAKTAFHTLFFGKYSFNIRSSILLSEIPVSLICALCY